MSPSSAEFSAFSLDARLLRALGRMGILAPTPVQQEVVREALDGMDVLARAKTGSGKTLAYAIPIVQKALSATSAGASVVLVPTRELATQVHEQFTLLTQYCSKEIYCLNLAIADDRRPQQQQQPGDPSTHLVFVATPSKLWRAMESRAIRAETFCTLVIDEADLVLSFGYEGDVQKIFGSLPLTCQYLLMSATLPKELMELEAILPRQPRSINVQDDLLEKEGKRALTEYSISSKSKDKFLLVFVLLKLKVIHGKCLIFVNHVDTGYKLKLFLAQFSVRSCMLNTELPLNTRHHIIQEFNRGVYDTVIALDEQEETAVKNSESGIARGIDFRHVNCVINFDLPQCLDAYVHRVGRTARANESGTALTLVSETEQAQFESEIGCKRVDGDGNSLVQPFAVKQEAIENFRYRCEDALKAITKSVVREARVQELKMEVMNSERLKAHFDQNPRDLDVLRHDRASHTFRGLPYLKHVPGYLLPGNAGPIASANIAVSFRKKEKSKNHRHSNKKPSPGNKKDPLKSLQFRRKMK